MEINSTVSPRRLYKSRQNRVIDGVCGGIAEYFGVDSTVVRILWVLITLLGGSGLILYIIAMIIVPVNRENFVQTPVAASASGRAERTRYWGIVLILVGAFLLMINFGWFADFDWWSFSSTVVFPVLLIIIGILFIYVYSRKRQTDAASSSSPEFPGQDSAIAAEPNKDLRRSLSDRKICGVCGGIAVYFNLDSTLVRILFIVLVLASVGWGLLMYIVLCIIVPEERLTSSTVRG